MSESLAQALEASWPPIDVVERGGWRMRWAPGAGSRVCSARRLGPTPDAAAFEALERHYRGLGASALIQADAADQALAAAATARGYGRFDATGVWSRRLDDAAALNDAPMAEADAVIEMRYVPAALARLWSGLGVGDARQAVMARAVGPKLALAMRVGDRLGGAAFVACAGPIAFIHALAVSPDHRRRGVGDALAKASARFAEASGAERLVACVVDGNVPAERLFENLGARKVGGYAYFRDRATEAADPPPGFAAR